VEQAPGEQAADILPLPAPAEEVDVWWGSFAGLAMLPSFLMCLALTAFIAWAAWVFLPAHLVRLGFLGLGGALWLTQAIRWSYRYFGFNYRLTNRRLFCHRGFSYAPDDQLDLDRIARVVVQFNWWQRWLGVGQVMVFSDDPTAELMTLEGVYRPAQIAEQIRVRAKRAHEPGSAAK
jgi:hypothetical protein